MAGSRFALSAGGRWPKLREVDVRGDHSLTKEQAPQVEIVRGPWSGDLVGLEKLHTLTGAGSVTVSGAISLRHVELFRYSGENLDFLAETDRLETLAIAGATSLKRFSVSSGARLADSESGRLALQSPKLADLGNVGELGGLVALDLQGVRSTLSLESLADAAGLQMLDIRGATGITDLSPLVGLENLKLVAIRGSGVKKVPDEIAHLTSRAAKPDIEGASKVTATKAAPPKPSKKKASTASRKSTRPVPEEQSDAWEQVVAGLATFDHDTAMAAVDLAATLDPAGIEFLLSKIIIKGDRIRGRAPIRVGTVLAAAVAGRLLVHADAGSDHVGGLQKLTKLTIEGSRWHSGDVVMSDLGEFLGLETLVIRKCGSIRLGALSNPVLHTMSLRASKGATFDGPLPPSLRRLVLARGVGDLKAVGASQVEDLLISNVFGAGINLSDLAGNESIRKLTIDSYRTPEGMDVLQTLPLEEVGVRHPATLYRFVDHPTLKSLNLLGYSDEVIPSELKHICVKAPPWPRETMLE